MGVGAITGIGGAALAGKGATDVKSSMDRDKAARQRHDTRLKQHAARVAETNTRLTDYERQKEVAQAVVVERMRDWLRRHDKQVRAHARQLFEGIDTTENHVIGADGISVSHLGLLGGAVSGGAAAFGAGAGITALVASFGVASTGTAISGLSGAAATNAVAAFLGGGSLASGGGGMALGATALRFGKVGPAVLVGGLAVMVQGQRTLTQAQRIETEVTINLSKIDAVESVLDAIDTRTGEMGSVLADLQARAVTALKELESEEFDAEKHTARFQRAIVLTLAVREVLNTHIIDESGTLTIESSNIVVKYQDTDKDQSDD